MKRLIASGVLIFASRAVVTFGGDPVASSNQIAAPPPGFFRSNEFDLGAFRTFASGIGSGANGGKSHPSEGGADFTYWFPWKNAGVRFQGTGNN